MAKIPDGWIITPRVENGPGNTVKVVLEDAELVKCKNCRYWRQEVSPTEHWVCAHHSFDERKMYTTPDFYCADGKKKEEKQ